MERKANRKGMVPASPAKGQRSSAPAPQPKGRASRKARRQLNLTQSGRGQIKVKHTEYVCELETMPEGEAVQMVLNPGNDILHPWLARIARNYEHYTYNKLSFQFKPMTSTANGMVVMAIDYDAADPKPTSCQQLFAYEGAVQCLPTKTLTCHAQRRNLKRVATRYVLRPSQSSSLDPRVSHSGSLFAGVYFSGSYQRFVAGTLWVSYEVTLMTPQSDLSGLFKPVDIQSVGEVTSGTPFSGAKITCDGPSCVEVHPDRIDFKNPAREPVRVEMEVVADKIVGKPRAEADAPVEGESWTVDPAGTMALLCQTIVPQTNTWVWALNLASVAAKVLAMRARIMPVASSRRPLVQIKSQPESAFLRAKAVLSEETKEFDEED